MNNMWNDLVHTNLYTIDEQLNDQIYFLISEKVESDVLRTSTRFAIYNTIFLLIKGERINSE